MQINSVTAGVSAWVPTLQSPRGFTEFRCLFPHPKPWAILAKAHNVDIIPGTGSCPPVFGGALGLWKVPPLSAKVAEVLLLAAEWQAHSLSVS